jgi:hypothetical protein
MQYLLLAMSRTYDAIVVTKTVFLNLFMPVWGILNAKNQIRVFGTALVRLQ